MEAFPANSLEDPFLSPDHDPVTQAYRGSSPQRIVQALDLPIPDFLTPSGPSGADNHPSSDASGDESQSFGEAHAADTLVNLANWSSQSHIAHYHELQTTICPEAVRPRAATEADYSILDTPPPYPSVSSSSSSSFAALTPAHFDIPIHPDAFEAEPKHGLEQLKYGIAWPPPSSQTSALSDLPPSSVPKHPGGLWHIDSDLSSPPLRRAPSPSFSTASSATWENTPWSPSLGRFSSPWPPPLLKFRPISVAPDDPLSPAVSMLDPTLDLKNRTSPHEVEEEEVTMGMDSPSQVYHQLTDPLDAPDPIDVDTGDNDTDTDYVDKVEEEEYKRVVWVRGPQKQNHRKTFKVGLWE